MDSNASLSPQASKPCPRCGEIFTCQAYGPTPCVCFQFQLSATLLQHLRDTYTGCLCTHCLQTLENEEKESTSA